MFRLQEHMPNAYLSNSRDFQLFCRLYEFVLNSIKYDINSITNINNVEKINERLLPLLAIRDGFFTDYQFDTTTLRAILKVFPYMIKYKGTLKGIRMAVNTILKLEHSSDVPRIKYNTENKIIEIAVELDIVEHRLALEELLKYVVPIGAEVSIIYEKIESVATSQIKVSNILVAMLNNPTYMSQVVDLGDNNDWLTKVKTLPSITDGTEPDREHMDRLYTYATSVSEVSAPDKDDGTGKWDNTNKAKYYKEID